MGPKPLSVNTCQEIWWKAISGLLSPLLMNDVRFSLSRSHRDFSALGPHLQCISESPLSLLSCYFARRHCGHQSRHWWEEVEHPPALMAHLFNLPHICSLPFTNHARQGCGAINKSGKQMWKAAEHISINPGQWPCRASEHHQAGALALKYAVHPKYPYAKKTLWVKFWPHWCHQEIIASRLFFMEFLQIQSSKRTVPSWPERYF